ncbi:MAG: 16S rRNA (cytidine(1402)-2'-O)-methyltransferase [Thermodesulfobacteriota bacterium]
MVDSERKGILYVVATPIGNLEDITIRAVRILGEVDFIVAEDTRHTRKLLSHFNIRKPLVSCYKDNEAVSSERIILDLLAGRCAALVSDAGTPAISDPGTFLVAKCREHGIAVHPVPGPSALTAALSISGLSASAVSFFAFLPSRQGQRRKFLASVAQLEHLLVFYEAPRRLIQSLSDCYDILGDRSIFVAREVTKLHEEALSGLLSEVIRSLAMRDTVKGECVIVISPANAPAATLPDDLAELLCWYRDNSELSMKDAVKKVASDLNLSRSLVYREALALWRL